MEPEVKSDIEKLIGYSVEFAENLLLDSGEYYPFGSKISSSGKFTPVSFFEDEEYPESQKIINELTSAFEEAFNKNKVRAYSIAYDVRVQNEKYNLPKDAILISIKHENVEGKLIYYYPYKFVNKKKLEFLEPWGEHEI
ncbi:hypothetical protein AAE02nite_35780 [Adhaeribacter aerolatus]|uniref:Uncharacterized protein n=1 Tax=Adhaeribacter aerolatus TaxID=670289 RepID=A0A512B1R4_9BACT|nr:hypothetical protein [Adhaeribacter aerolatus]GEO05914.1 hypothetical protein AAE02nite_35780 [Adhaeribacter aerolatus]